MKYRSGRCAAASLAALTFTAVAHAAAPDTDEDTVVVTAARAPRTIAETGNAITVIDDQEIARRQSVNVADLLRGVPGVTYTRSGSSGAFTSVTIRGAESDQTVALIDGVKLNDPSSPGGGFDFGNLLVGNIDRIEVVRGSQSVLWGSQAIGGVVNTITRTPTERLSVNARAEGGWRGSTSAVANVSGKFGPVSASVGGGYFRTNGFSAFDENLGGRERDGYRNIGANAKIRVTLTDRFSVDLRGWYSDGRLGVDGFAPPDFNFGDTREFSLNRQFVGYAGLNAALFGGRLTNRLAYAYTEIKRDNFDPDGFIVHNFDGRGTNERFEYQGGLRIAPGWTLDFGAEEERSRFRTASFGSPFATATARIDSGYGQLTARPVANLTLAVGVRYDAHSRFGGQTNIAANGAWSPNRGQTVVRASYGEGFKAPSLFQLFSDFGNERLRPESAASWDAGVTQKLLGGRIEANASWFNRDTDNLIIFVDCPVPGTGICTARPFGTYDNVQRASAQGLEASLAVRPNDRLSLIASYSFIDAVDRTSGRVLARRPRQSLAAAVDYRWAFGLTTGVSLNVVGNSFDDAANARRLNGYALVDLRASFPITKAIELYGRVENLLGERYETVFQFGTQPRAAFGGVRAAF